MDFDYETGFKVLLALVLLTGLAGMWVYLAADDERAAWNAFWGIQTDRQARLAEVFECAAATSAVNVYAELLALDNKALSLDGVRPSLDQNLTDEERERHLANAQASALEFRSNLVFLTWFETLSARGRAPFPWSPSPGLSDDDLNRLIRRGMSSIVAEKLTAAQLEKIGPLLDGVVFSARSAALLNQQLEKPQPDATRALVQSWSVDLNAEPFRACGDFIRGIDYVSRTNAIDPFIEKET